MKTVLVTGGAGFIGVELANLLANNGYAVTVYDKALNGWRHLDQSIQFELADITTLTPAASFDYVYHLAATNTQDPYVDIMTNVLGTLNIVRNYPESRLIFASSSAAADAASFHGINKKCAEHFINTHKNSVSIRFNNVFGERQAATKNIIPTFIYSLKNNVKANITGDGTRKVDYTYILDLVDEVVRIGESKIKGQTETGYGAPIKILDLYKLLATITKKKENYKLVPAKKKPASIHTTKYKIKEPKYGFMEGLRRTVRWYLGDGI